MPFRSHRHDTFMPSSFNLRSANIAMSNDHRRQQGDQAKLCCAVTCVAPPVPPHLSIAVLGNTSQSIVGRFFEAAEGIAYWNLWNGHRAKRLRCRFDGEICYVLWSGRSTTGVLQQQIERHGNLLISSIHKQLILAAEHPHRSDCVVDNLIDRRLRSFPSLERRWHGLWLRSLEQLYRLEQPIAQEIFDARYMPVAVVQSRATAGCLFQRKASKPSVIGSSF
ncbi:unnamed protein product [Soboliphyme baturini]|uniref:DUF4338 domain-containing protein n=1 Tax=Soboliphyme baturini TaxID=241478 RepID=A0A183J6K2_9BILA|nr:unnamed protein product [Soboliphyme baturini]